MGIEAGFRFEDRRREKEFSRRNDEARLARGEVKASDIATELPGVPRSSAYRHLVDLQGAGVVRRIAASDEFARFELAENLTERARCATKT